MNGWKPQYREKTHWEPRQAVSWPTGKCMRTFHTGHAPVCGVSRGRMPTVQSNIHGIGCKRCLRIAKMARIDATGEPAFECVEHEDCRQHVALGRECKRTSLPSGTGRSQERTTK